MPYAEDYRKSKSLMEDTQLRTIIDQAFDMQVADGVINPEIRIEFVSIKDRNRMERKLRVLLSKLRRTGEFKLSPSSSTLIISRKDTSSGVLTINQTINKTEDNTNKNEFTR